MLLAQYRLANFERRRGTAGADRGGGKKNLGREKLAQARRPAANENRLSPGPDVFPDLSQGGERASLANWTGDLALAARNACFRVKLRAYNVRIA